MGSSKRKSGVRPALIALLECLMYPLAIKARRVRIEVEGELYHVIARGNGWQAIFHDDEDHRKFLSILGVLRTAA